MAAVAAAVAAWSRRRYERDGGAADAGFLGASDPQAAAEGPAAE